ncbi:MAG: CDP-alcohol phosphatidyltransferase family protein [Bradymonadales bacterium]|jgi:phosphatidylglycerophosphate synthase
MNIIIYIDKSACAWDEGRALADVRVGGLSLIARVLRSVQTKFSRITLLQPSHYVLAADDKIETPEVISYDDNGDFDADALAAACGESSFFFTSVRSMLSRQLFDVLPLEESQIQHKTENTGIYFLHPERFSSLSNVAAIEAALQSVESTYEVDAGLFHRIKEKKDVAEAQKILTRSLKKPLGRESDGLVAYFINRPMSLQISRFLANSFVTPNMITALGLLVGLIGAACVGVGSYGFMVAGVILWQTSSMLDGVDGELARMRLSPSHSGEWFDTVVDDIINVSFLIGLGHGVSVVYGHSLYFILALCVGAFMSFMLIFVYREFVRLGIASHNNFEWGFEKDNKAQKEGKLKPSKLKSIAEHIAGGFAWIAKRDFYTLLLMFFVIFGLARSAFFVMLAGTALVATGIAAQLTMMAVKKRRKKA